MTNRNLSPQQFPLDAVLRMDSPEFDSTVSSAVDQMHNYYARNDLADAISQRAEQDCLVASVRRNGVLRPIDLAAPTPDGEEHMLLNGHHRVAASVRARKSHIPAVVHQPVQDASGAWDYPTYYRDH